MNQPDKSLMILSDQGYHCLHTNELRGEWVCVSLESIVHRLMQLTTMGEDIVRNHCHECTRAMAQRSCSSRQVALHTSSTLCTHWRIVVLIALVRWDSEPEGAHKGTDERWCAFHISAFMSFHYRVAFNGRAQGVRPR
jgi:hypothetical protein